MKETLENKRGSLGSSLDLLVNNLVKWGNMMDLLDCNLDLMVSGWVTEHMQDLTVSNLVTCHLLGLECMDSLLDQVKMDFQVVGNKVNIQAKDHLHHWHLMVRSLVHLELHHCPTLKY